MPGQQAAVQVEHRVRSGLAEQVLSVGLKVGPPKKFRRHFLAGLEEVDKLFMLFERDKIHLAQNWHDEDPRLR